MSENKSNIKEVHYAEQAAASKKDCDGPRLESKIDKHVLSKIKNTSKHCEPRPHDVLFGRG